ncbi:MAG: LysR family transcriptional regulator [Paracoccaceae bacterium]
MPWSRRYLPSISQLRAFEAVMRTGSTTAAAAELNMTQGAVSRHIQGLEAQLGTPLFLRERRQLVPGEAARHYARSVAQALDLIGRASMELAANPGGGTLSLAILPAFGTRWLAPRLPDFLSAHPGVTVNLATRLRPVEFDAEGFDAAIHFGAADLPGCDFLKLGEEPLQAACAPAFLRAHPVARAGDLLGLPLLQLESRPRAWERWFAHHGVEAAVPQGMIFDQFATMTQAAIHGVGVALLPRFLAQAEFEDGRLVPAFGAPVPGRGSYWLAWPRARADYPPLRALRDWLARNPIGG